MRPPLPFALVFVIFGACLTQPAQELDLPAGSDVFVFSARNETYRNQLLGYSIVAETDLTVDLLLKARLGSYTHQDDCIAGLVISEDLGLGHNETYSAGFFAWAYRNHVYAEAVANGNRIPLLHDERKHGGGREIDDTRHNNWTVPAGKHVRVYLGGRSSDYALQDYGSGSKKEPNEFAIRMEITGSARLLRLPPVPVRCGLGTNQAQNGTGAYLASQDIQAGGAVGLETRNASSLFLQHVSFDEKLQRGTIRFHNETWNGIPKNLERSSQLPGSVEIRFDNWIAPEPTPAWFLADLWLPFFEKTVQKEDEPSPALRRISL